MTMLRTIENAFFGRTRIVNEQVEWAEVTSHVYNLEQRTIFGSIHVRDRYLGLVQGTPIFRFDDPKDVVKKMDKISAWFVDGDHYNGTHEVFQDGTGRYSMHYFAFTRFMNDDMQFFGFTFNMDYPYRRTTIEYLVDSYKLEN